MKRSELKAMIKECVKETLFEEGVLSEIIAEVAFGLTKAQATLLEQKTPQPQFVEQQKEADNKAEEVRRQRLLESKRKMLDAIGDSKMAKVFEGTEPLSSGGKLGSQAPASPLAGRDPNDSGVDISGLFSLAGQNGMH